MAEMGAMSSSGGGGGGGAGLFDSFTNLGDKIQNNILKSMDTFGRKYEQEKIVPLTAGKLSAETRILAAQAQELEDKKKWQTKFRRYMLGGKD